jgi:uncharacterized protein involved in exopolysaccharide biosynthesis
MNTTQRTPPPFVDDDALAVRALFRMLWAGRWIIGAVTFAAAVISVIVALMIPNSYRAEALLAPNNQDVDGGLSGPFSQYREIASLAGFNLGAGAVDKTALGLEILKSRKFISDFIERHDLLVPLLAAKEWDYETGELVIDSRQYDMEAKRWVRTVSPPKKTIPSMQEAHEEFVDILSVSQDINSGFVTVSVEHYSPIIAKQWVDNLVEDLNSSVMRQDVAEAEQAIEYLQKQIERTSLADLHSVFFRLIEEQTKTVMLASASKEYLLKTIDPAVAPEKKSKPNRSLIVVLSALLGFLLGAAVVSMAPSLRARKKTSKPVS